MNFLYAIKNFMIGSANSKGTQIYDAITQSAPTFVGKLTQATTTDPTIPVICDTQLSDDVTLTPTRTGVGVYTITASASVFGASADKFWATPVIYCDTSNVLTVMNINWTSATVITITTTTNANVAKDAKVTKIPFSFRVYSA
jgi:hypothetical protein